MRHRIRRFAHRFWLSWEEQSAIRYGDAETIRYVRQQIAVDEATRTVTTVSAKGRV